MEEQVQEVQTENSTSNNEEVHANAKKVPQAIQINFHELKTSEYYMVKLQGNKFLAKDDMPLLYHKKAAYQDEITKTFERAVDVAAKQSRGIPVRADKGMGKLLRGIPTLSSVLVLGKLIRKRF